MKKILIIDDEESFCSLVKMNLERCTNWSVSVATNGSDGIALAGSLKPDLILLDLLMPGISGYDVKRALKNNPMTRNIPVILLTALSVEEAEIITQDCIEDYLVKPVSLEMLKKTVEKLLSVTDSGSIGHSSE